MSCIRRLHDLDGFDLGRACSLVEMPRSTYYRLRARATTCPSISTCCKDPGHASIHPRALNSKEREYVLELLDTEFVDVSPYQAFASLLERGEYVCSISTMYRLLRERAPIRERRDQLKHPKYEVPRLTARAPNQVWTWDITKLPGPQKWTSFYLYSIIDLFSRYVVGFMVATRENSELAVQLIRQAYDKQGISPGEVVLHADRGAQMTSKTTSQMLIDLGLAQSHSRPRVSNDNAFSESQFKTLKYRPDYPGFFEDVEGAREWARETMGWYNTRHFHKGLGLMHPRDVHYGKAESNRKERQKVMQAAMERTPERFVRGFVEGNRSRGGQKRS